MRPAFEIGQWFHWPSAGRVIRGRVATCAGPDDEGIYDLTVRRSFPPVLFRVLSPGRGCHARRNLEVQRYEMHLHTIKQPDARLRDQR